MLYKKGMNGNLPYDLIWMILLFQAKLEIAWISTCSHLLFTFDTIKLFFEEIHPNPIEECTQKKEVEKEEKDVSQLLMTTSYRFFSVQLHYTANNIECTDDILLENLDYIIGTKLFTKEWFEAYFYKKRSSLRVEDFNSYCTYLIDDLVDTIKITSNQFVLLEENGYQVKDTKFKDM